MSGGTLCPRAGCPGGHSARGDILPSDTGCILDMSTRSDRRCRTEKMWLVRLSQKFVNISKTILFFLVLGLVPIPSAVLDRCLWLIGLPWSQVGCSVASYASMWNELYLVRLG